MSPPRRFSERAEPSLRDSRGAPRLVPSAERADELWAGDRIIVDSQPDAGETSRISPLRVAAVGFVVLLALVGGATLVRAFVGL